MILRALVDYYDRRAADLDSGIARQGWEWKALPFVIEIDGTGRLVQIVDTRSEVRGKIVAAKFLVPQAVKRTVAIAPNLLWDTVEYALGAGSRNQMRVALEHGAFAAAIRDQFGPDPHDAGLKALYAFLADIPDMDLQASPLWPEMLSANPFVSFRVAGDADLICGRPAVRDAIGGAARDTDGLCLVTGQRQPIARLHPAIKGVRGTNAAGGSLVSFNHPAFESFGRAQGVNAPVGEPAAFAYTTGLNDLLARQRVSLADSSIVFWAERSDATDIEAAFSLMISEPRRDDPLVGSEAVRTTLERIQAGGALTGDDDSRFFVLTLAPNAARISVRDMSVLTVSAVGRRIAQHYDDLKIVLPVRMHEWPPLSLLLRATATQGKSENVPPNLAGDIIRAVLSDNLYPTSLLQAAVRRARLTGADGFDPMPWLASVIKASLNRSRRKGRYAATMQEELTVALDTTNPSTAYRLGRLFALLEWAQERASGGNLNATIRDRFYGAAAASPVTVFARLLMLKNHHVSKFDRAGDKVWLEREIGDVLSEVDAFPAHLDLAEQGLFAVGYYHQRQSIYSKKSDA